MNDAVLHRNVHGVIFSIFRQYGVNIVLLLLLQNNSAV